MSNEEIRQKISELQTDREQLKAVMQQRAAEPPYLRDKMQRSMDNAGLDAIDAQIAAYESVLTQ